MDESQITSCRICGGKIAVEASACPHCGAPKTSSTAASPKMLDSKSRGTYIFVIGGISSLGGIVADVLRPLAPFIPISLICSGAAAVILSCFWSRLGNLGKKLTGLFWCWSIVCTLFIIMQFLPFVGEDAKDHGVIANIIPGVKNVQNVLMALKKQDEVAAARHEETAARLGKMEDAIKRGGEEKKASKAESKARDEKFKAESKARDEKFKAESKARDEKHKAEILELFSRSEDPVRSVASPNPDETKIETDLTTPPHEIEAQTQLARASLLESQAWVDKAAGNEQAAWDGWRQSLKIRRAIISENLGDMDRIGFITSLRTNASFEWENGQKDAAFALLQECYGEANQLYLASKTPLAMEQVVIISGLYGILLKFDGDNEQARLFLEKSLELRQALAILEPAFAGGKMNFLIVLSSLADLEYLESNFERAMELYIQELAMARGLSQRNETVLGYEWKSLSRLGEIDMKLINDEEEDEQYFYDDPRYKDAAGRFMEAASIREDLLATDDVEGMAELASDLFFWTLSIDHQTPRRLRCPMFSKVIALCDELKGTEAANTKSDALFFSAISSCSSGVEGVWVPFRKAIETLREAAESSSPDSPEAWDSLLEMEAQIIEFGFEIPSSDLPQYIDLLEDLPKIGKRAPALLGKIEQIQLELNAMRPPEKGIPLSVLVSVLLFGFGVLVIFIILGIAFYKLKK